MGRTNIYLDDKLVKEGMKQSKIKTKRELVQKALEDFVRRNRQKDILKFFGKIKWEGDLAQMRAKRVFK